MGDVAMEKGSQECFKAAKNTELARLDRLVLGLRESPAKPDSLAKAAHAAMMYGVGFVEIRHVDPEEVLQEQGLGNLRHDIDDLIKSDEPASLR